MMRGRIAPLLAASLLSMSLVGACGGDDPAGPPAEVVARIDVSAATTTLAPQQTVQMQAVAKSATGSAIGTVSPTWSSSSNAVATVNASGCRRP